MSPLKRLREFLSSIPEPSRPSDFWPAEKVKMAGRMAELHARVNTLEAENAAQADAIRTLQLKVSGLEQENIGLRECDKLKTLYLQAAEARIARLEGVLIEARADIKADIECRFASMGKEYLAKEYVESSSMLKHIDAALAQDEVKP